MNFPTAGCPLDGDGGYTNWLTAFLPVELDHQWQAGDECRLLVDEHAFHCAPVGRNAAPMAEVKQSL